MVEHLEEGTQEEGTIEEARTTEGASRRLRLGATACVTLSLALAAALLVILRFPQDTVAGPGGAEAALPRSLACAQTPSQQTTVVDVRKAEDVLSMLRKATDLRAESPTALRRWRIAQEKMLNLSLPVRTWLSPRNESCPLPCKKHWASNFGLGLEPNGHNKTNPCGNMAIHPHEWTSSHESDQGLADESFFEYFLHHFQTDPEFFLGLVYIPIPWKSIIEDAPRIHLTGQPRLWAEKVMQNLDPDLKYFTVMMQSHIHQTHFANVSWEQVLVFDSRGAEARDSGYVGKYPRVAVPLLYGRDAEVPFGREDNNRSREVFFAGGCHSGKTRLFIGPGTYVLPGRLPGERYDWKVNHCDQYVPYEEFKGHLQNGTWVLTPAGYYPTSFGLFETLQGGALPVIPYDIFTEVGSVGEPKQWLPYQDIGVRFGDLGLLMPLDQMQYLKREVEAISEEDVLQRLALVRKYRPLWTSDGLITYILYRLSLAQKAPWDADTWKEAYRWGRAVTF